ncbi:MAG: ATP-binding protein, partial [Pseudomonadota bacterium]
QMIASYLDFARGEGGEELKTIYISSWLMEVLPSISPPRLQIEHTIDTDLAFNIKSQAFKRAIGNILGNAAKYASKVKISAFKTSKTIRIEIEDNGSGISDEEKTLVFKPFYRSDKSRHIDDTHGNVGLGLAITKEIIQGHNGDITMLDSKDLGGLLVRINLPLASERVM